PATVPISADERAKADAHRVQAARKLKMARVLGESDLGEEARSPMLEAILALGQALAVENRLPEPESVEDALRAARAFMWKGGVEDALRFIGDPNASWKLPFANLEAAK